MDIIDINEKLIGQTLTISGWIKNHRKQANFGFISLTDGTSLKNLQVVYDE
jgi:asparaginyl-tRNA synthetase